MSFHATFSAKQVLVNYAGVDMSEGRPDDVFITISETSPRASFRKGVDGNTSAALSSDHSAQVTLSFFPESTNAKLMTSTYYALREAQKGDSPVLGAFPLGVVDPSGSIAVGALEAVLESMADRSIGNDTGTIDFVFYVENLVGTALPSDLASDAANLGSALGITLPVGA